MLNIKSNVYCFKQILIDIRNSNMKRPLLLILSIIALAFAPITGFSQCNVSSTLLNENFNSYPGTGVSAWLTTKGESLGDYSSHTSAVGINDDATNEVGATNEWKENSSVATWTKGGNTCPDHSQGTGYTGAAGDRAFIVDGAIPNGSIWCYTSTAAYSAGSSFNISAAYSSPWCSAAPNYNPAMYYTVAIDGGAPVKVSASEAIVTEFNTSPTAYQTQSCYYSLPAAAATSVKFCICLDEYDGTKYGSQGGTGQGQGNDIMLDNIVISTTTGGGCAAASGTCTYPGPIVTPVELLTFDVQKVANNTVSLKWSTASEKNSSYFSVEKSDDGINFSEIGIVRAQGTSNNIVNYKFDDDHFSSTCYYRLKIVDKDGSFKYSSIQFIETGNNSARIIKTETGEMEIRASVNEDTRWNIAVYSLLGQEYTNQNVQLTKGENTFLKGVSWGERSAKIVRITSLDGSVILSQVAIW
jgi:hypothetical protein